MIEEPLRLHQVARALSFFLSFILSSSAWLIPRLKRISEKLTLRVNRARSEHRQLWHIAKCLPVMVLGDDPVNTEEMSPAPDGT